MKPKFRGGSGWVKAGVTTDNAGFSLRFAIRETYPSRL